MSKTVTLIRVSSKSTGVIYLANCSVLLTFQLQIERNQENLIIDRYTGKSMV